MTQSAPPELKLHLRDRSSEMVAAWRDAFAPFPEVAISQGDILSPEIGPRDAVISPANSFGFMDGGVDRVYSEYFGWQLQERLRALLLTEHDGELPVGQALILPTHDTQIPYLVSAPTMRVPMAIAGTTNVYVAFRAALRAIRDVAPLRRVVCPGFGTGYGRMPPERAARQMAEAYRCIVRGERDWAETAGGIHEHQRLLLR